MPEPPKHFVVERVAGRHTRLIELDANSEDDAKRQVDSLHAHEKSVQAKCRVELTDRPKPRPSGYGH